LRGLLRQYPPLGACTHFHSADADDGSAAIQLGRFRSALGAMAQRPAVLHAENSPAIERLNGASVWTLVRPGVFLYGVGSRDDVGAGTPAREAWPGTDPKQPARPAASPPEHAPIASEPVVALRARIVELRWIEPGESVSYGATFRATERRRIATVAAGYADGYRRAFSNVGHALVRGRRVPVAGIVTMDMTMLDVTGVDCVVGDTATLLGADIAAPASGDPREDRHPRAAIDLPTAARGAGLCTYELLTGLRLRVPRVYLDPPRA
jgi:alanine racemase